MDTIQCSGCRGELRIYSKKISDSLTNDMNHMNRTHRTSLFVWILILALLYFICLDVLYSTSMHLQMGLTSLKDQSTAWSLEALPWTLLVVCAYLFNRACARVSSFAVQLWLVAGLGLVASLWLTIQPLSYSMDLLRYLWDGRLLAHGFSPYNFVPGDPRISSFRDWPYWSALAWKNWPEAYPPLAQMYFAIITRLSNGTVGAYKWFMFANGWVANVLFYFVLVERNRSGSQSSTHGGRHLDLDAVKSLGLVLLFPPLLVESYGTGHVDALALPYVLWAWLAAINRRPIQLGLAIAMATAIKLFPVVLFAAFWRRGEARYMVKSLIAFCVGMVVLISPFLHGVGNLTKFFGNVSQMDYNGSFEFVLQRIFGKVIDSHSTTLIALAVMVSWALIIWAPARQLQMEQKASLLGLTFFLASPVVHPWYFIVLIPFAVVGRDFAVLWLAVTSHFTYDEVPLDMYIEYVPAYVWYLYRWVQSEPRHWMARFTKRPTGGR